MVEYYILSVQGFPCQAWPAPHPASDDDQLEQQRHQQDPPLEQDLPSHPVDLDQHAFHSLCAPRILSDTGGTQVWGQGIKLIHLWSLVFLPFRWVAKEKQGR